MEYTEQYNNMEQRNSLCDTAVSNGFRMLHDNFDSDWKRGDEPHGTLIFTDEPAPQAPTPEPVIDPLVEIAKLKTDYDDLKAKVDILLEKK